MTKSDKAKCLICHSEIVEIKKSKKMVCVVCGGIYDSIMQCAEGHYVCDDCNNLGSLDMIEKYCKNSATEDPLDMAIVLLRHPSIRLHSAEHYYMVMAVLTAAYFNKKKDFTKKTTLLKELRKKYNEISFFFGEDYYISGEAIATGIFVEVIATDSHFSDNIWILSNNMLSRAAKAMAYEEAFCSKRNTYAAILEALDFLRDFFDVIITHTGVECEFSDENKACSHSKCPFYQIHLGTTTLL